MKRGETWEDVTPSVMGKTAEPRTTPRNSRIQPIEMEDDLDVLVEGGSACEDGVCLRSRRWRRMRRISRILRD